MTRPSVRSRAALVDASSRFKLRRDVLDTASIVMASNVVSHCAVEARKRMNLKGPSSRGMALVPMPIPNDIRSLSAQRSARRRSRCRGPSHRPGCTAQPCVSATTGGACLRVCPARRALGITFCHARLPRVGNAPISPTAHPRPPPVRRASGPSTTAGDSSTTLSGASSLSTKLAKIVSTPPR